MRIRRTQLLNTKVSHIYIYIEIHPRGVLNHVLRKESREPMELEATLVNMIML